MIERRDIPVGRADVLQWLQEMNQEQRKDIEAYITSKLAEKGHEGVTVNMGEQLGEVPLAEVILMELDSYEYGSS